MCISHHDDQRRLGTFSSQAPGQRLLATSIRLRRLETESSSQKSSPSNGRESIVAIAKGTNGEEEYSEGRRE